MFGKETNQSFFSLYDFVCLNYHFFTKLYFVVIMFCEKQEKTKYHSGLFNMTKGGGGIGGVATTFKKGGVRSDHLLFVL